LVFKNSAVIHQTGKIGTVVHHGDALEADQDHVNQGKNSHEQQHQHGWRDQQACEQLLLVMDSGGSHRMSQDKVYRMINEYKVSNRQRRENGAALMTLYLQRGLQLI
jgi:hypothetical protein